MILKISQIKIDQKFYPRNKYSWYVANDYKNSMLAGAKFPDIDVALYRGQYYLIDGRHRIEATKLIKKEHIQCKVHKGLTEKQIFVMAVKANIEHGVPLSTRDKVLVIDILEKLKFSAKEISKIVNIPIEKIEKFKVTKITNTVSGETVYLKATTKHYAGVEVDDNFVEQQDSFNTRGQERLLIQVIDLLENGLIDFKDNRIINIFTKLKGLVNSIKIPLKVKA